MPESRVPSVHPSPNYASDGTFSALENLLYTAFRELDVSIERRDLLSLSAVVGGCMAGECRRYHNLDHIFEICIGTDPVVSLAILFHDTVYFELDGGLPDAAVGLLDDALHVGDCGPEWSAFDVTGDPLRALVSQIFGIVPGARHAAREGMNELASALLAARSLKEHLDLPVLSRVIACIEATIPFRGRGAEALLAARLAEADRACALGLGDEGVRAAVRQAVLTANCDVGNFGDEFFDGFLKHTWLLIQESSPDLGTRQHRFQDFYEGFAKMETFLEGLEPDRIFRSYLDTPSRLELQALQENARMNLNRAVRFLREKRLACRVLESFAPVCDDGGAAFSYTGLCSSTPEEQRYLTVPAGERARDVDPGVLRVLLHERGYSDFAGWEGESPAAYLYAVLGDGASDRLLGTPKHECLLDALPSSVVTSIETWGAARIER